MKNSHNFKILSVLLFLTVLSFNTFISLKAQTLIEPEKFFGFKPGSDRMLFSYENLIKYLQKLDSVSGKMKMVEIGKSPMGKPMYAVFISSEQNINQLDELKAINKKLALEPNLSKTELDELVERGKVFLMTTLSMHSTEVGPTQAFPLVAYQLVNSNDTRTQNILNDVVYMVVPNSNPDGMDMIVDHYNKYKGTKYEKCSMPGVYHKYVGHDNNRDFVNLSQQDNKNVARLYNTEWYPQVLNDKHQMGNDGTRYFVPPYHDPIAENIEAELWNWSGVYGANLIKDMTADSLAGVSQHVDFDNYWPGSTETAMWKNVVAFLTEAASTKLASPIYIEASELNVDGKGLAEYKKSTNMPLPWPGGWWRLGNIVDYELSSAKSILATTSANKSKLLRFRNEMCKKQVNLGKSQAPYYYILPQNQQDKSELIALVKLLQEHGIVVQSLTKNIQIDNRIFNQGDVVVSLSQPYRAFIKEVMEKQKYPERHYTPNGELIQPYDITTWSLPLNMGLKSFQIDELSLELEKNITALEPNYSFLTMVPENYTYAVFNANNNESYKIAFAALAKKLNVNRLSDDLKIDSAHSIPKGSFVIEKNQQLNELISKAVVSPTFISDKKAMQTTVVKMPRIALIETWFSDMDAGWTRFVLDTYQIPFTVIRPGDIGTIDLAAKYDVLIFPDNDKSIYMEGKVKRGEIYDEPNYPSEFIKGMGEEGFAKVMTFIDNGGIILSWGESTKLFAGSLSIKRDKVKEEFKLPFENESEAYTKSGLYVPGSLFQVKLLENHPLTYGMDKLAGVYYSGEQAFKTKIPNFDMDRRIIASFPEENLLLSGYAKKSEMLANKPAMIWMSKGKGQFVLYAFNPINRASTTGVYKLVFNALLIDKLK